MQTCQTRAINVAARGLSVRSRSAAAPGLAFSARVSGEAVQQKAQLCRSNARGIVAATASGRTLPIDLRGELSGSPARLAMG